jgi:hypothetical protein
MHDELKTAILEKAVKHADDTLLRIFEQGQRDFMELYNAVEAANTYCRYTYLGQALDEARKSPLFKKGEGLENRS